MAKSKQSQTKRSSSTMSIFSMGLFGLFFLMLLESTINHRVYDLERQDKTPEEGKYTIEEYIDTMNILAEVNSVDPNGYAATLKQFDNLTYVPSSILEIGFGLGNFTKLLGLKYPQANVLGIDTHILSVNLALNNSINSPSNVHFELRNKPELDEPNKSYDIITTTFVNHHIFPNEAFIEFLKKVANVGRKSFIFNDYHRSLKSLAVNTLSLYALRFVGIDNISKIVGFLPISSSESTVLSHFKDIFHDRPGMDLMIDGGVLSMKRSFSIAEYEIMFAKAGYPADALTCHRLDKWYSIFDTCRVVCHVDLSWNTVA
jgi:2-polyprenyl-3-methyl-5-hydroxy-6-metoxy-1,4-benzoquinol methylase